MTTVYRSGSVSVSLDEGLANFVRQAAEAASGGALSILEREAETVAQSARADWYGPDGVKRRTGTSGDIAVVTVVTDDEVRVSVGSTDLEKAKYVHRPGPLSRTVREITEADYWQAKRAGGIQADLVFAARKGDSKRGIVAGRWYRSVANPLASDGKYLLAELIRKPMNRAVRAVTPEIGRAITDRAGG